MEEKEASSAESAGEFWLWQMPECVKQRDCDAFCGAKASCFSGGQFCFAVESLDRSG
jgi:hypothetical protein